MVAPTPRRAAAALIATAALLMGAACGEPTGVPDPADLEVGTFRADLTGAEQRSLRGRPSTTRGSSRARTIPCGGCD